MVKKIDVHTHLGDILYGTNIIHKPHQELKATYYERLLKEREAHFLRRDFHYPGSEFELEEWRKANPLPEDEAAESEAVGVESAFTNRNFSASLLEMQKSMVRNKIDYCAVMPVMPQVSFEDIKAASLVDNRVIPFTSIDFSVEEGEAAEKLLKDVQNGAKGLKIHPVIQKVRLDDSRIYKIMERWTETGLPMLPHIGVAEYFPPEKSYMDAPENGEIEPFLKLVKAFPDAKFIAGHGGNESWRKLLEECVDMKNVVIDTSMATPESLQTFLKEWGPERLLFASDWPWLTQEVATALIEQEIENKEIKEKVYFKNACRILKMDL